MTSVQNLKALFESYKKWVMNNPGRTSEMETIAKYLSYIVAGKVNNSPILSELIYSLSNLFTFYNDMLIRKAQNDRNFYKSSFKDRLKLCLTILHYCEVLFEITSRHKWGTKGKWGAATFIQIVRCVSNLILVHQYGEIPLQQPPIPALQRRKIAEDDLNEEFRQPGFVLKRSGRVIRIVEGGIPVNLRDWKPIDSYIQPHVNNDNENANNKKIAETLYAIKPLVHLGSIAYFGSETWRQWLVYLCLDVYSLHLYEKETNSLNYDQRVEMQRRKLSLLLYLLRTPMYQKYSSSVIHRVLNGMANNIPLMGLICKPFLQYLPDWQDTYFYMWPN